MSAIEISPRLVIRQECTAVKCNKNVKCRNCASYVVGNIAGGRVAMVTRGSSTEKPLHPKRGVTFKHGEFNVI